MPTAGFERIDHTADVGLRLTAPSEAELFVVAAEGLKAVWGMPRREPAPSAALEELRVTGPDIEGMLVAWLNELIYQAVVLDRVAGAIREPRLEPDRFRAEVAWLPVDWEACEEGADIKAATYHALEVTETEDGFTTTVILDV